VTRKRNRGIRRPANDRVVGKLDRKLSGNIERLPAADHASPACSLQSLQSSSPNPSRRGRRALSSVVVEQFKGERGGMTGSDRLPLPIMLSGLVRNKVGDAADHHGWPGGVRPRTIEKAGALHLNGESVATVSPEELANRRVEVGHDLLTGRDRSHEGV
jgi:hypothetical protein